MIPSVTLIIPVWNAAPYLPGLAAALQRQIPAPPAEILFLDSRSTDATVPQIRILFPESRVLTIESFSHGGTRQMGVQEADGEFVVFMTQDALPANEHWLAELLAPLLADPTLAAATSRQLPRPQAGILEQQQVKLEFPPATEVQIRRPPPPGEKLTGAAIFFSNVSAAYRRQCLLDHPFDPSLIMGEDQQAARDLLLAGYGIAYAPASRVIHSHGYPLPALFRRYFDSAVANRQVQQVQTTTADPALPARQQLRIFQELLRHHPATLPAFFLQNAVKAAALACGRLSPRLPKSWCRRLSMHPAYWNR